TQAQNRGAARGAGGGGREGQGAPGRGGANAGAQGRGGPGGGGGGQMVMSTGGGGMMVMGGPGFANRHKYNLTLSINAMNVLNHLNPGQFNGTLTSPFFGRSNGVGGGGGGGFGGFGFSGARRIDVSLRFNF
ncbi:MAG: hypothetical protein WAV47_13245, partial [Blastocatellia bacterium]